jgi:hypothetical protein
MERDMSPDDRRSGQGALIAALILSVASLAFVLWIVAVSREGHGLFAVTSADAPETAADIASRIRASP